MITKYKPQLNPLVAIIAAPFLSWNPSVLTVLGLVSSIVFFFGIIEHVYWLSIASIIGFLFDALDGYVARAKNKESAFGGFLDSTCDRIADFLLITSFGFAHLVQWELVVLVLCTTFLISYIRSRGEAVFPTSKKTAHGLMQRTERIVLVLLFYFLFLLFPNAQLIQLSILTVGFIIIFILNCITIFQRFVAFVNL